MHAQPAPLARAAGGKDAKMQRERLWYQKKFFFVFLLFFWGWERGVCTRCLVILLFESACFNRQAECDGSGDARPSD